MEYTPQDFSQAAINNGQRQINYALTVVDMKLIKIIETLRDLIVELPVAHNLDVAGLNDAIADVTRTSRRVADIKPPGCDTTWL